MDSIITNIFYKKKIDEKDALIMKDKLETFVMIIIGFCIGVLWLMALVLQWFFQMIADFFDSVKEFFDRLGFVIYDGSKKK